MIYSGKWNLPSTQPSEVEALTTSRSLSLWARSVQRFHGRKTEVSAGGYSENGHWISVGGGRSGEANEVQNRREVPRLHFFTVRTKTMCESAEP